MKKAIKYVKRMNKVVVYREVCTERRYINTFPMCKVDVVNRELCTKYLNHHHQQ